MLTPKERPHLQVLLLHAPLLASAVWEPMASALSRAGHAVAMPPLASEPVDRWWHAACEAALESCPAPDLVVAHSGAGVLAPLVLAAAPRPTAVVLVDAVSYLRLSPAYDADADSARQRGWGVIERPGRHLDILNRPADVAVDVLALCGDVACSAELVDGESSETGAG